VSGQRSRRWQWRSLTRSSRSKTAAEPDLFGLAGVHIVGLGRKLVAGQRTDQLPIKVYVEARPPVPSEAGEGDREEAILAGHPRAGMRPVK
jgi:hypothetical protein